MKNSFIILFSCLLWVNSFAQNLDIEILRNININRYTQLDGTFRVITNSAAPVAFGIPTILLGIGLLKKDSTLKRKSLYVGTTVVSAALMATVLKYSINRERPFVTYPFIQNITSGGSPSFPSGHTTDAFAWAAAISIVYPKWYVIAPSFFWASAIAYSRLDLGVHYPSDVLAGVILGSGSAYLSYKLNKWINKKYASKKHYSSL